MMLDCPLNLRTDRAAESSSNRSFADFFDARRNNYVKVERELRRRLESGVMKPIEKIEIKKGFVFFIDCSREGHLKTTIVLEITNRSLTVCLVHRGGGKS